MNDIGILRARAVQDRTLHDVSEMDDLSASVYDIAVASLVEGPQQVACVQWLLEHEQPGATWGAPPGLSWYDTYISTYAASVALQYAGLTEKAHNTLQALGHIIEGSKGNIPETLTFGGLIGTLDRFREAEGWQPICHRNSVLKVVSEEEIKWGQMLVWDRFYDPTVSIAGYCGERVFGGRGWIRWHGAVSGAGAYFGGEQQSGRGAHFRCGSPGTAHRQRRILR